MSNPAAAMTNRTATACSPPTSPAPARRPADFVGHYDNLRKELTDWTTLDKHHLGTKFSSICPASAAPPSSGSPNRTASTLRAHDGPWE